MDFPSIVGHHRSEKAKAADYTRVLHLLLQGIAVHAVPADEDDLVLLRKDMAAIAAGITEQSNQKDLLVAAGKAIHSLEAYSRRASAVTQAQLREFRAIVPMMTQTIQFLSRSSHTALDQLHSLEKNLVTASAIEDIRLIRAKLGDCLGLVRNESLRLKEESTSQIDSLTAGVQRLSARPADVSRAPETDFCTGLRGRAAAERAVAEAIASGAPHAVAAFLIDRLSFINVRFGRVMGDHVLKLMAQHLTQELASDGELMRWSGPAFVAVMEVKSKMFDLERKVKRIAATRIEKDIETDQRSVILPISCSTAFHTITAQSSVESLLQKLDSFVGAYASESGAASPY